MPPTTWGKVPGDWIKNELGDYDFHTKEITLLAGSGAVRDLKSGMVLSQVLFGTPTEDHTGNTGDGAMSGLALTGPDTKVGDYVATCIVAVTNGGVFEVVDPDGAFVGIALVGVAFTSTHLGFTIADGATDFVVGDAFTITVPAGSNKYVQIDLTKVDGSQLAKGILFEDRQVPDGTDAKGSLFWSGPAVLLQDGLNYNSQTVATVNAQLLLLGLIVKTGV